MTIKNVLGWADCSESSHKCNASSRWGSLCMVKWKLSAQDDFFRACKDPFDSWSIDRVGVKRCFVPKKSNMQSLYG